MTNKLKYFIGNWKMFGDFSSFKIINRINQFLVKNRKLYQRNKIILCIPNTLILAFNNNMKSKTISFGAQNCHQNSSYGPFTGSINSRMLKRAGADYIILGHSENRAQGETNFLIKKKIRAALSQNLKVIFCIGETLKEKRTGKTRNVLKKQIKDSLDKNFISNKIFIAYEPVWSIGSNQILKSDELVSIINFIKKECKSICKFKFSPKILYGGSVNGSNIKKLSLMNEIDGFLIGSASLSSKKFIDIIKNYYK